MASVEVSCKVEVKEFSPVGHQPSSSPSLTGEMLSQVLVDKNIDNTTNQFFFSVLNGEDKEVHNRLINTIAALDTKHLNSCPGDD